MNTIASAVGTGVPCCHNCVACSPMTGLVDIEKPDVEMVDDNNGDVAASIVPVEEEDKEDKGGEEKQAEISKNPQPET